MERKEAIEVIKKNWPDSSFTMLREALETIIPELKESEDERIRKALIDYFNRYKEQEECGIKTFFGIPTDNILAWLEKQSTPQVRTGLEWLNTIDDACDKRYAEEYAHGEYCHEQSFKWGFQEGVDWLEKQSESTDINPSEFDLRLNKLLKQFETLSKEELASSLSFYLNVVQNDGTYKAEEKQGEQKPTDKVEPKFKVGDWIVDNCGYVWKIEGILNQFYLLEGVEGGESRPTIEWTDNTFHLWTIQDAKAGDVLASELCDSIILFKGINDDNNIDFYCDYDFYETDVPGDRFSVNNGQHYGNVEVSKDFHPATKEQRDILMKAMANAGYTFDFEKKELEKIEQNPTVWSEEDKDIRNTIIRDLKRLGGDIVNVKPAYKEEVGWLKSLEQRIGWKPTKEQMEALHDLNLTGGISYAGQGQVLIELYNDLKKL